MATLYVVATPIGNLEDVTYRAVRILGSVARIACEDTRVARKLLDHYQVHTPLISHHAYSSPEAVDRIVAHLRAGEDVALITDAGTPLISDPGHTLIASAIAAGASVVPIPGASAAIAALSVAGLPTARVLLLGFLPRSDAERREILSPLRSAPYTLVIYESPKRVHETLEALLRTFGDRPACLARELTKKFETLDRGGLAELASRYTQEVKGEVVLVVGPAPEGAPAGEAPGEEDLREEARRMLADGVRPADVARTIAGAHGLSRQDAYKLVLEARRSES